MQTTLGPPSRLIALTYFAWCSLGISVLTSISLYPLFYLLILAPGLYYTYYWIKSNRTNIPKSFCSLLALSLIAILSVIINREDMGGIKMILKTKYLIMGALAIAPTYQLLNSPYFSLKKRKLLFYLLLISSTMANLSGLIAYLTDYNYLKMTAVCLPQRACGTFSMPTTYGFSVGLFALILPWAWVHHKRFQGIFNRNILIFPLVLALLGLYLSFSRAAIIGYILGFPLIFWGQGKKYILALYGLSFIIMGAIAILIVLDKHPKFLYRYTRAFGTESDTTRISLYQAAFYGFKENPIFGLGLLNFQAQSDDIKKRYQLGARKFKGNTHNSYLEILVGCGIFGFLALLCFHFFWLIELFKSTHFLASFALPIYVNFSLNGLFQHTIIDTENIFPVMGIYAFFQAAKLASRQKLS